MNEQTTALQEEDERLLAIAKFPVPCGDPVLAEFMSPVILRTS
jgi:hypothetical protein